MGHSRDEKHRSHERIVGIASTRIREAGIAQPAVAEIMAEAGLTHGGFYKHFESRDALIAEAVERTFADGQQAIASLTDGVDEPLAALIDWYASVEHRDDPAGGCGVVALGADVLRGSDELRGAYRAQVERYLARLTGLLGDDADARRRATVMLSTLVGAVLVARAIDDEDLSQEILANVRGALKASRDGELRS